MFLCVIFCEFFLGPKGYFVFFNCYHALSEVYYIPGCVWMGYRLTSDSFGDGISSAVVMDESCGVLHSLVRCCLDWYNVGYKELASIPYLVGLV